MYYMIVMMMMLMRYNVNYQLGKYVQLWIFV